MPVASVKPDTVRKELKSLPEGYVVLRRMTYGEKLHRQSFSGKMRVGGTNSKDTFGEIDMINETATLWEWAHLILEHNLEIEEGGIVRPANFKDPRDVRNLDSKIGEEIETYIGELNNFEASDELGNSSSGSVDS